MALWVVVFLVSSIFGMALLRRRVQARRKQQAAQHTARSPYQAVTVKRKMDACAAVTRLDGQRIICADAPSFPLPDCDAEQCNCRYQFHGDRRDADRRLLGGVSNSFVVTYGGADNREQDDRRRDE